MTRQKRKYPRTLKRTPAEIAEQHLFCRMDLLKKGPHTGLYCAEHGTWIKWISQTDADIIKDMLK